MNKLSVITGLPFSVPPISYIADSLPWHKTEKWEQRPVDSIKRIIIHHTASEAPLYNQASYHVNTHGWPGLSYHLIISGGRINQVNSLEDVTYHAASNNFDTVAICIHGDLSKREMTSLERELLYGAILTVKSLCNIEAVIGHNEVNATSCPCISMNQVRSDILTLEHKIERSKTWESKMRNVADIVNQINYLTGLMKAGENDGNAQWAAATFAEVADIMRSKHML